MKKTCSAGHDQGITIIPEFIVGPELQTGRLIEILESCYPHDVKIYATCPRHRHLSAKVRLFVEYMTKKSGERPVWQIRSQVRKNASKSRARLASLLKPGNRVRIEAVMFVSSLD